MATVLIMTKSLKKKHWYELIWYEHIQL
jgi:hypothetical protein